jgi:hypothetical protein
MTAAPQSAPTHEEIRDLAHWRDCHARTEAAMPRLAASREAT